MTARAHEHHAAAHGTAATAAHATLHCLLGCAIGEFAGLAIGVTWGLGVWPTMILATALAFAAGLNLAVLPLIRGHGFTYRRALATIWLGEAVSIAAMEVAMNAADYAVGGVQVMAISEPTFWLGYAAALPAGFAAAFPVNWWLIGRNLKPGH